MRKTKIANALLIICLSVLICLAACSTGANGSFSVVETDAAELQSPYVDQDPVMRAVADGANDFAFCLSSALAANVGDENFVCSPYPVWLQLAALANATDEQNKAALLSALGAAGISETDINKAASRSLYDLTGIGGGAFEESYNPLKIVSAIFAGNDVTFKDEFAQTFTEYYRGSAVNVDFSSREAVDAVNSWASENTDGLIADIIQEFDPQTVAAIANAVYYSNRWTWEFEEEQTAEGTFHAPTGDTSAFYMLREHNALTYYEDDNVQAMPLSFKGGGGMYIILPKTGSAVEALSSMTNEYFKEIQRDSILAEGKLLLPRFSIENDVDNIKEALELIGVPLFDEESAPLSEGMLEEDTPVWLSDVTQKAAIYVDEKGTTAAAVTLSPLAGAAMPQPTEPFEMNCNRPFIFALYGYAFDGGNRVLFTGIVNQP